MKRWLDFFSLDFWRGLIDVRLAFGGGGGAQGETRYNWNPIMEAYWGGNEANPGGLLGEAADLASQGFQQYGGQRFMRPTDASFDAYNINMGGDYGEIANNYRNMLRNGGDPIQAMQASRGQIEDTLGGDYLNGPNANPFAGLGVPATNTYIGGNEYMGEAPAFDAMMGDVMGDLARGYEQGTSTELTRMANLTGNLGGSAHLNAMANNQAALAKQMGQTANQMRSAQFDKSAGLREAEINRGFQNFNMGLDRGMQGWEGERNRMMGAIPLGQAEQGLGYQRLAPMMDLVNFGMGVGQQNLDFAYNQFQQQQQHPYQSIDWLSGILGRAMGGGGMNTTIYGPSSSGSTAANILGAGLGAYGMFRN